MPTRPNVRGMDSNRTRRGPFIRAKLPGRCPGCGAGIIPNIHWVAMEYQSRTYFHDRCWKKELNQQSAELQALLDEREPKSR